MKKVFSLFVSVFLILSFVSGCATSGGNNGGNNGGNLGGGNTFLVYDAFFHIKMPVNGELLSSGSPGVIYFYGRESETLINQGELGVKNREDVILTVQTREDYIFDGWYISKGDYPVIDGNPDSREITITIEADRDDIFIVASFLLRAEVRVAAYTNGVFEVDNPGGAFFLQQTLEPIWTIYDRAKIEGCSTVDESCDITISAQANEGYYFDGWYYTTSLIVDLDQNQLISRDLLLETNINQINNKMIVANFIEIED